MRPAITAIRRVCVCVLSVSLAPWGCGGPEVSSSKATGTVKGKVTVRGKSPSKTQVTFNPSNVNRKDVPIVSAPVQADGSYEATTLVGQNLVSLSGPGVAKTPQAAYFTKTIDVKQGANELDITLP